MDIMLGRKPLDNIKELVDFERLKHANGLMFKWGQRFNISKRMYATFMALVKKRPEHYKKLLPVQFRSQFSKDCKIMFYAAEVESILVEQYTYMVLGIIRKLGIYKSDEIGHFFTEGCIAVKHSAWQYRNYHIKASFNTFVHRSIFMRIKGKIDKIASKKARRLQKFAIHNQCDMEFSFNSIPKTYAPMDDSCEISLDDIVRGASLTEKEECLIRAFVNRKIESLWYKEYREKFPNTKTNKIYSRQSISLQLMAVQRKVFDYLRTRDIMPEGYIIPKDRRGDFK
jgi:hypothetical protein